MHARAHLSLGSRVKLEFGANQVIGTIIEDRGPIGMGGRQLLRVEILLEGASEPIELEVPAEEVELVD